MDVTAPLPIELYQQICDTSLEGIWVVDADARTLYINERLGEMLGYAPREVLGRSVFDFVFPEDYPYLHEKLARRRKGIREQHDFRYRRKDGSEIRVTVGTNPLLDSNGEYRGTIAMITDVSERYQLEREREDSRQALRSLFDNNPEAVYLLDMQGRLQDVNSAAESLTGYSRAELLELSWQPLVVPEDLPRALSSVEESKSGACSSFEVTLVHRDGHHIPIAVTSFPLKVHGTISGVYGVVRDVSARKRTEENLHFVAGASQALGSSLNYHATLERTARLAVPVLGDWCIVAAATEGERLDVATAAADPETDFYLRELHTLTPDILSLQSPLSRLAAGQEPEIFENPDAALLAVIAGHPEAERVLESLHPGVILGIPLKDHGRRRGVLLLGRARGAPPFARDHISLAQDLAHLAAVALENAHLHQELRRSDHNKNQFLTTLAHELRNPLSAIRSSVEVLMRAGTDHPRGQRALQTIERQVRHEARLLDDLLNVARIARGKVLLRFQPVELTQLVRSTLADYAEAAEGSGLRLELTAAEEPLWVSGDPTRLSQAVANLLNNAIKFTDTGGEIRVQLEHSPDRHWVCLTVEDTGIGIDPSMLQHLFEPFSQAEALRERSQGLGLGLALVKGLVEIHGGEVRATSEGPGRGSRLSILLPLAPAPAPPVSPEAAVPSSAADSEPHRVLVVDDNHAVAESMFDLLQVMGFEVDVAYTGPEALRAVEEFQPQVVLCDLGLPGIDGYEVARRIRANPGTAGLRLIALTGAGTAEAMARAEEAGFDHCLLKPIEPADIQQLIVSTPREPRAA